MLIQCLINTLLVQKGEGETLDIPLNLGHYAPHLIPSNSCINILNDIIVLAYLSWIYPFPNQCKTLFVYED